MTEPGTPTLLLTVDEALLPVAVQFVEAVAVAFGQGATGRLKLGLATEEIFAHLCHVTSGVDTVEIVCADGAYCTRVVYRLRGLRLDLKGLNMTAVRTGHPDDRLDDLELAIAARSVDRFHIVAEQDASVSLVVEKDKEYPRSPRVAAVWPPPTGDVTIESPDAARLKELAVRTAQAHPEATTPAFFAFPGRVVDMVVGGEYRALAAIDAAGHVAGGALFHFPTDRIVRLVGPYMYGTGAEDDLAARVLDACLMQVARSRAIGLLSTTGIPAPLQPQFEVLGHLTHRRPEDENDDRELRTPVLYRLLQEDPGCTVWAHPDITDYLEERYGTLILAREIRTDLDAGEARAAASVFSAEIERQRAEVTLRPLLPGDDAAANLEDHMALFRHEGLVNVFFELDLGVPWHATLVPALLSQGLRPCVLVPLGGRADLLLFQVHAT